MTETGRSNAAQAAEWGNMVKLSKLSKLSWSLLLTGAVLAGTVLSGCGNETDYTEEIKEYQAKLESLAAENEELKAQLGMTEPVQTETPAETQTVPEETQTQVSENDGQAQVSENNEQQAEAAEQGDNHLDILVFGDSIWGSYRDEKGVSARVEHYLERKGYDVTMYNAAIGGTRATLDPEDNEYKFGPASESSLPKMVSILRGDTDVELLQGKPAYEEMKAALAVKDQLDYIIVSYGMNDFLNQVPINSSDDPWTGFGTALTKSVRNIQGICPSAQVLIASASYASYFPIPVQNMGEKALYNYASIACDVARGENTLCLDAYNNLGMDAYNADEYLEDGIHLNEKGRDLYAKGVASCILGGTPGQISSNNLIDFE